MYLYLFLVSLPEPSGGIYKNGIRTPPDMFIKIMGMWLFILNQVTNIT